MTIQDLHQNEALRHREFPVTARKNFLAHAAVCPLPRRVADAVRLQAENATLDDQETAYGHTEIRETRALAAKLINADLGEVALVGPTSLALSFVAGGLSFRRAANILVYYDDYPSNVYPWMALAEKGVEVRFINVRQLGRIRVSDVLGQVDENTALVALASCHFISGWRIEYETIGLALREQGILFCLDAIQTVGAFPINAQAVDFLAADAHKWLLGPCAAGILYVRKEVQDLLEPIVLGWHNVRCANFVAQENIVHPPDARRYEAGSFNLHGYVGLKAAMELLLEIGVDNIGAELVRKRDRMVPVLQSRGWEVVGANAPEVNRSGIVAIRRDEADLAALHARLAEQNVVLSLRTDRQGRHYLRFSPHFYNTDAEIDRAIELLG
ncbi:MAG TPA: aminotransferase [Verrucomicrobiales bacterium]|nr:aminotransferase [Verrucomicrobiales bacterium]